MAIALNPQDKERVRYHLGYQSVEPAAAIQLGFPRGAQPQFLVEAALERVMAPAVPRIYEILGILDGIERQMVDALKRLKAQQLGELKLRNSNEERTEQDLLEAEYLRWAQRLGDQLGVPLNAYSARFQGLAGGGINTPVATP